MYFGMGLGQHMVQRLELSTSQLLIQQIRDTIITPKSRCPKCRRELTEDEIRAGWTTSPTDFTTACPRCHARFKARLILTRYEKVVGRHVYMCIDQLFYALKNARHKRKVLGKGYLSKNCPSLLWNMIRHFGTYEAGLREFSKASYLSVPGR